jgi:hypothetical protein
MAIKVYKKRGNTNYKEKRLIESLQEEFAKRVESDPNFSVEPAKNFSELEQMFNQYCTEAVDFTEVPNTDESTEQIVEEVVEDIPKETTVADSGSGNVDPFNRQEPIVRDYVKGSDYVDDVEKLQNTNPNGEPMQFSEPTSFEQSFRMPTEAMENAEEPLDNPIPGGQAGPPPTPKPKQNQPGPTPNPIPQAGAQDYAQVDGAKQRKQTKRFAKSIVRLVSGLFEKGIVFWGTKDIHEAKLQELELTGEIDFSLVVSLDENQETTIRDFFASQEATIQELAVVTKEEQDRLTESLTEILLEKGVAPSNGQMMIIDVLEVFGIKAMGTFVIQRQNMALLNQLRMITDQNRGPGQPAQVQEEYTPPYHEPETRPNPNVETPDPDEPAQEHIPHTLAPVVDPGHSVPQIDQAQDNDPSEEENDSGEVSLTSIMEED